MSDHVLVTGAAGFLGRAVVLELLRQEKRVSAVVRPGSVSRLSERVADAAGAALEILEVDLEDLAASSAALKGFAGSAAIHLAARRIVGPAVAVLPEMLRSNVVGTANLIAALSDSPLRAFVFASSGEVYGRIGAPFEEGQAPEPETPYALSKQAAELAGFFAHRRGGLPFVAARLGVVYGPGQTGPMFVPQLLEHLLSGVPFPMSPGAQTRDFIHVADVARALTQLTTCEAARGSIVNVASGEGTRLLDVAHLVGQMLERTALLQPGAIPYRDGEAMDYRLDTTRLHRLTGFRQELSLEEGLRDIVLAAKGPTGATPCIAT